jgi:hypothetical protein
MCPYTPPVAKKERKASKALLPLIGIILAVLFGVVAYLIAPGVLDFTEKNGDKLWVKVRENEPHKLSQQLDDFREERENGEDILHYATAGLLWLVLVGGSALLVSAFVGEDPAKEALKYMGPHPSDKKAIAKAQRRELRERQKRIKQKRAQVKRKK